MGAATLIGAAVHTTNSSRPLLPVEVDRVPEPVQPLATSSTRSGGRRSQAPCSTAFPTQRPQRAGFETATISTTDETATLAARRSNRCQIGLERRGPRPLASSMFSMPRTDGRGPILAPYSPPICRWAVLLARVTLHMTPRPSAFIRWRCIEPARSTSRLRLLLNDRTRERRFPPYGGVQSSAVTVTAIGR